ncbi:ShlB/FhaC/HecB family hemolysin secretion/activation protein [Roseibium sp. LAB1]
MGDRYSLRGYRFDEAQGDLGLISKLELSLSVDTTGTWLDRFEPFVFLDAGTISNLDPTPTEIGHSSLVSAGAGWSSIFARNYFVNGWLGVPLVDGEFTERYSPAFYLSLGRTW